ncbi:LIM/homeobox protein Awh-like [Ostrea edulis]|uniref:LIM/homeobox protein Awh-like n=1 Tax=Ostrea edulis TaxID=37623 RepID=UPI0024AF2BAE|nr:LIM/homeobox protein Awh-like [Ostrea edulis]
MSNTYCHTGCLRCYVCCAPLQQKETFVKSGNIYCRQDYLRLVVLLMSCSKCSRQIEALDWMRRARDKLYHLACFACDTYKRQLSTGEEFALVEDHVLCIRHYKFQKSEVSCEYKSQRVPFSFTEEQFRIFQANFDIESNPDRQSLNSIVFTAGISRRVAQVWFRTHVPSIKNNQIS